MKFFLSSLLQIASGYFGYYGHCGPPTSIGTWTGLRGLNPLANPLEDSETTHAWYIPAVPTCPARSGGSFSYLLEISRETTFLIDTWGSPRNPTKFRFFFFVFNIYSLSARKKNIYFRHGTNKSFFKPIQHIKSGRPASQLWLRQVFRH